MELAMLLNGLMAAPTFADWIAGQPLDIDSLLYGPEGKPQVSIFYIAHLAEAERQFFVTLLLEQVVSWMQPRAAPPACGRCSTWTSCSAICRRIRPTRPPRSRC